MILSSTSNKSSSYFNENHTIFKYSGQTQHTGNNIPNKYSANTLTIRNMSTETAPEPRKAGVSSPTELKNFVSAAGDKLLVVDVRHPDANVEPGDAKSLKVAGFPDKEKNYRPNAVNLPWSRETNGMELPEVDKDTYIITHCGGGGRGQKVCL